MTATLHGNAWLLSTTFYGHWLPGDPRGFVSRVRDQRPGEQPSSARKEHDQFQTPYDADLPGLARSAQRLLKGEPIQIDVEHAHALRAQFEETVVHRGWHLLAGAIMFNHLHLVVILPLELHGMDGLQDLKAYGSRKLNRDFGRRPSETWWTSQGSARLLPHRDAIEDAVHYVLYRQPNPLLTWYNEELLRQILSR
jgi:REP element-mobilizing transposase RayT